MEAIGGNFGVGGEGVSDGTLRRVLKELQSVTTFVADGAAANNDITVTGLGPEDTILSALQFSTGVPSLIAATISNAVTPGDAAVAATRGTLAVTISNNDAARVNGFGFTIGGEAVPTAGIVWDNATTGLTLAAEMRKCGAFESVVYSGGVLTMTTDAKGAAGAIAITGAGALLDSVAPVGTDGTPTGGDAAVPATPGTLTITGLSDALAATVDAFGFTIGGGAPSTTNVNWVNAVDGVTLADQMSNSSSFSSVTYSAAGGGTLVITTTLTGTGAAIVITGNGALLDSKLLVGVNGTPTPGANATPGVLVITGLSDGDAATVDTLGFTVGGAACSVAGVTLPAADGLALATQLALSSDIATAVYTTAAGGTMTITTTPTGTAGAIVITGAGALMATATGKGTDGSPTGGVAATASTLVITGLTDQLANTVNSLGFSIGGVACSETGITWGSVTNGATLATQVALSDDVATAVYNAGSLTITTQAVGLAASAITLTAGAAGQLEQLNAPCGTDGSPGGAAASIAGTATVLAVTDVTNGLANIVSGLGFTIGGLAVDMTGVDLSGVTTGAGLATQLANSPDFASVVYGGTTLTFTTTALGAAGAIVTVGDGQLLAYGQPCGTDGSPGGAVAAVAATPNTTVTKMRSVTDTSGKKVVVQFLKKQA